MSRNPGKAGALALAALTIAAPLAAAAQSVEAGAALAPAFLALDGLLGDAAAVLPQAGAPFVEAGRWAVLALRDAADATAVGATDGAVGAELGTPDEVSVAAAPRTVAERVAVPAQPVSVGGAPVGLATPEAGHTLATPEVGTPGASVTTPEQTVEVALPALDLLPNAVHTPPFSLHRPALAVPDLSVAVPGAEVPPVPVHADLRDADVHVDQLRGTLYAGPYAVPYQAGPLTAGAGNLPPGFPRSFQATTPGLVLLEPDVLLTRPGQPLAEPAEYALDGQEIRFTGGGPVFPGLVVSRTVIPSTTIGTQGFRLLDGQERYVRVAPQQVETPVLPGAATTLPGLVVHDKPVAFPGAGASHDPFGDYDGLGYYGYGRSGDSSLYPFACTPAAGCLRAEAGMRPWVEAADAALDALAASLDGEVALRVG